MRSSMSKSIMRLVSLNPEEGSAPPSAPPSGAESANQNGTLLYSAQHCPYAQCVNSCLTALINACFKSNHRSPVRFTTSLTLQWFCPDNSQYWPKENADTGLLFYLYHHPCPRQCWQRRRSEQVALQHLPCLNSAGLLLMTSWSSGTVFPLEKIKPLQSNSQQ